jgi:hypothetical protein
LAREDQVTAAQAVLVAVVVEYLAEHQAPAVQAIHLQHLHHKVTMVEMEQQPVCQVAVVARLEREA